MCQLPGPPTGDSPACAVKAIPHTASTITDEGARPAKELACMFTATMLDSEPGSVGRPKTKLGPSQ